MNFGFLPRWQRRALVFLLGLMVCWALGWALVPPLLRWQIEKQGTQSLGRVVHVDQVVFKPWSMTLVVRGLQVGQAGAPMASAEPQLTVDEIEVNAAWRSLVALAPVTDALVVRHPQLHITHLGQGRFDVDDVLQRVGGTGSSSSGVPRLSLFNIQVVGGDIRFRDAPQSVTHTLTDLRLDVPFLSNMDGRREVSTHPRLAFKLNGAAFDTDAQTTPFSSDRHTQARFQIQGLDVAPYLPYWPAAWPMRLREGRVEADITLDFRQQTTPQVQVSGRLALAGLKFNERVNAGDGVGAELPWVQLGELDVKVANWQPLRGVLQIDGLRLDQPVFHVRRDRAGALNWSRLQRLTAPASEPAAAPAQTDALYAVKQLQVTGGQVQWHDAATPSPVALALTQIDLQSANLSWPRPQTATWDGQAQFQGGRLSWQGVAEGQSAQAGLKWRDLPLQALAPYAAQWLRPEVSGQSSAELSLDWRSAQGAEPERWVLKAPLIRLTEVSLGAPNQPEARLAELAVEQLEVDVLAHQARVGRVALSRPLWRLSRSAQGRWSVEDWQVPGRPVTEVAVDVAADARADIRADDRADAASGSAVSRSPWRLNLRQVQVRGLTLDLDDRFAGDAARLRWGDLNYAGELNLAWPEVGMDLNARGQVSLAKLRAVSLPDGEDVLAVQALNVRGLDVGFHAGEWAHLKTAETSASDFFARVDIDPTGRLNLSSLVKTAAPVPAQQPATASAQRPGKTPWVVLGPTSVVNGRVLFSDHFIRPNYSADVTELAGSLGALSNQTQSAHAAPLADLSLRGRVAGSASLEVHGRINPLTRPVALDVQGQVRDLELPQLSPYSAKYAGYGIERGKLSADVNYRIYGDGQLQASHQLTLNQLRFGEHSEREGAPNLPVKLAVALLADRHGVIDLDLPVSGSINDPEFRVGAIVWRMVLNLVGKAILSPFSLMAGALGGADELQHMPFAPGQAELDAPARQKLQTVAQLLQDKPALRLTLVGEADLKSEREAWRRLKLLDLLQAERRRASKGDASDAPVVIDAGSEDYLALLKSAYRRSPVPKPRNVLGLVKDLPPADMEALLLAAMTVDESDMRELANARAAHVRQALLDLNVPADQLFMGAAVVTEADRKAPFVPQVTLVVSTD